MRNGVVLQFNDSGLLLGHIEVRPLLLDQIQKSQKEDTEIRDLIEKVKSSKVLYFSIDDSGVLWFGLRLCVPY